MDIKLFHIFWNDVNCWWFMFITKDTCIHLYQLRLLQWSMINMFRSLQCTMVNLFEARIVRWNDGVHASFKKPFWEGVQESSQVKWLRKFLRVSEQKNFIFKPNSKKLEAVSFTACLNCGSFLAKMLIISIKQMNTIPSLSSVIKNSLKNI